MSPLQDIEHALQVSAHIITSDQLTQTTLS